MPSPLQPPVGAAVEFSCDTNMLAKCFYLHEAVRDYVISLKTLSVCLHV